MSFKMSFKLFKVINNLLQIVKISGKREQQWLYSFIHLPAKPNEAHKTGTFKPVEVSAHTSCGVAESDESGVTWVLKFITSVSVC